MIPPMREDRYHIEMEDISQFPIERSLDCMDWEGISYEELESLLNPLTDDKVKVFLGVLSSGSTPRLGEYFYRIRPKDVTYS